MQVIVSGNIQGGVYPVCLRKEEKPALRKRVKFFQVIDGTLYHVEEQASNTE